MSKEEKFRFQGITPFCIEYNKTIEEVDNAYFENRKTQYIDAKVGTLYPFSLSYQDLIIFYWRLKQINFSVNISNTYKYSNAEGQCEQYSTETVTVEENKGITTIEPSDALESLKMRLCNRFDVLYKMKNVHTFPDGTREDIWEDRLDLFTEFSYLQGSAGNEPVIIAENTGGGTGPENYLYYPRMEFSFYLYSDSWGTFLMYNNEDESPQNEKTINIKIDGTTISSFKMHMVTRNEHSMCEIERNASDFGDWDIDLWSKPQ